MSKAGSVGIFVAKYICQNLTGEGARATQADYSTFLLGTGMPRNFITICKSFHVSFF